MHRRFVAPLVVAALASVATACGGSASPAGGGVVHNLVRPADAFVTLGGAGLGCPNKPTQLAANGAAVALCSPIAGVPKSFLTIGMYPSSTLAAQQYLSHCNANGWSLYRSGENWRGGLGTSGGPGVPRSVAQRIATALQTDLHAPCATPPPTS